MKRLLYRFLIRRRRAAVAHYQALYSHKVDRSDIEHYQVDAFNNIWRIASKEVPFYQEWKFKFDLPGEINSLAELQTWPILKKSDLSDLSKFHRNDVRKPNRYNMTGGSTGEPVRLPTWGDAISGELQVMAREAYGVFPGDRTFLLWGHEHLYGEGFKRKFNIHKRKLKDWLAGWKRVSAYDLGEPAMQHAYLEYMKFRPIFVIGFSPAVLAFVRINGRPDRKHQSANVSPKAVLCTAGPLSESEKREISVFFGAPVMMEYGSVECGVMAHTRPSDGRYFTFWNTRLMQAVKDECGEYKNIVTRLDDCYVPMIRYDIGDYLELPSQETDALAAKSVLELNGIKGRPSEMIRFKCGVTFFGALIGDCVKQVKEVLSSQIAVNEEKNILEIRVTANETLSKERLDLVVNRICLTVAGTESLTICVVQVKRLFTTVGGKIPRVVRLR